MTLEVTDNQYGLLS